MKPHSAMVSLKPLLAVLLLLLALPRPAHAHVGSKDVYEEATAGPYKLFVTIRMPTVIPGVATVEARSTGAPISALHITPLPLSGEAAKHAPTSDPMSPSAADPNFYTGGIWMMASGSWQVRFDIDGAAGKQTTSVPVAAVALSTLRMGRGLGIVLALLGLFLIVTMAGVVAAAIREARLPPGASPSLAQRRRSYLALAASLAIMALAVWGGASWWKVDAASYRDGLYRAPLTEATLDANTLTLAIEPRDDAGKPSPGTKAAMKSEDDFIPDHGHLMHLYAIREPNLDAVYHLHPHFTGPGRFTLALPTMPPGNYTLYADVVHANGFPETLVTKLTVPVAMPASNPGPDDAEALVPPLSGGALGDSFRLPDGYTMVWKRPATLTANTAYGFHFELLDPHGNPAPDMQPYMGMAGHAAFLKTDGTVFAHIHPEGSAAMAAMMLANPAAPDAMADMPGMTGISHPPGVTQPPTANTVDFPYGFPTPGRYRIFVQMKHNTTIETAAFDAQVQ